MEIFQSSLTLSSPALYLVVAPSLIEHVKFKCCEDEVDQGVLLEQGERRTETRKTH